VTDLAIPEPRRMAEVSAESRSSVPALVTYWLLAIWSGLIIGVFWLARSKITVDSALLTLIYNLISTQTVILVAAISFWVGATQGGKAANERLSEASKLSNAALQKAVEGSTPQPAPGTAVLTAAPDVEASMTVQAIDGPAAPAAEPDEPDGGELPPDQRVQP